MPYFNTLYLEKETNMLLTISRKCLTCALQRETIFMARGKDPPVSTLIDPLEIKGDLIKKMKKKWKGELGLMKG